jgi:hypothetical protein
MGFYIVFGFYGIFHCFWVLWDFILFLVFMGFYIVFGFL